MELIDGDRRVGGNCGNDRKRLKLQTLKSFLDITFLQHYFISKYISNWV
jgi:hypothetical protein